MIVVIGERCVDLREVQVRILLQHLLRSIVLFLQKDDVDHAYPNVVDARSSSAHPGNLRDVGVNVPRRKLDFGLRLSCHGFFHFTRPSHFRLTPLLPGMDPGEDLLHVTNIDREVVRRGLDVVMAEEILGVDRGDRDNGS